MYEVHAYSETLAYVSFIAVLLGFVTLVVSIPGAIMCGIVSAGLYAISTTAPDADATRVEGPRLAMMLELARTRPKMKTMVQEALGDGHVNVSEYRRIKTVFEATG